MYKLVAGLAEQQKPVLCQVIVVGLEHVMYVEVAHTLILDTAELASHIACTTDVTA